MVSPLLVWMSLGLATGAASLSDDADPLDGWPAWRGPLASGVAPRANPPVRWSESDGVRWKVEIPGLGSSSPIVWGDCVYLQTAVATDRPGKPAVPRHPDHLTPQVDVHYEFVVMCLDAGTGEVLWEEVAIEEVPHEGHHTTNGFASGSPVTDGDYLYAFFGSRGLFCFDLEGELVWKRDLGDMRTRKGWGEGASIAVYEDTLLVPWDQEDQSRYFALDRATGETRWEVERDEPTTWATPLVVPTPDGVQVIAHGTTRVRSYDLATGEVIWQLGGHTVNAIPTPVSNGEVVVCMSGYRGNLASAIRLDARGELTGTPMGEKAVVWQHRRNTPYVPSPLLYGDHLYFTKSNAAQLTCLDLASGREVLPTMRLPDMANVYASPVAAAGRVYIAGRDGECAVLKDGDPPEVLVVNRLDDQFDATPALAGRRIYLRGRSHLYCLERQEP